MDSDIRTRISWQFRLFCLAMIFVPQANCASENELVLNGEQCLQTGVSKPLYVDENNPKRLIWNGTSLPPHCNVVYMYKGGDELNKVCIKSTDYSISDCDFKLEIRQRDEQIKVLSCNDSKLEACGESGQLLLLNFINTTVHGHNYIKLEITGIKEKSSDNSNNNDAMIALIVVGVIILVAISLVIRYIIARRRVNYHSANSAIQLSER